MARSEASWDEPAEQPVEGVDEGKVQVLRPEGVAVGAELAGGVMELGRELDAGRASPDDNDREPVAARAELSAEDVGEQGAVKAVGLLSAVENMAPLGDARHAEIVGPAAEGQHEVIVAEPPLAGDLRSLTAGGALGRNEGSQHDLARLGVDGHQGARDEAVAVPVRVGEVAELLLARVKQAGGDLVEARLPDMRRRAVDKRHLGPAGRSADRPAETRRQLEAARAPAHDHDAGPASPVLQRSWSFVPCPAPGHSLRPRPQRCAPSQSGAT